MLPCCLRRWNLAYIFFIESWHVRIFVVEASCPRRRGPRLSPFSIMRDWLTPFGDFFFFGDFCTVPQPVPVLPTVKADLFSHYVALLISVLAVTSLGTVPGCMIFAADDAIKFSFPTVPSLANALDFFTSFLIGGVGLASILGAMDSSVCTHHVARKTILVWRHVYLVCGRSLHLLVDLMTGGT